MKAPKIHVELIPKTAFFTNLRSQLSTDAWDWLRKETYKQAKHKCEYCNASGRMEAHEIWHYDDQKSIQTLHSIVCLCNLCHLCMHLGYAEIQGKSKEVRAQLARINQWTLKETDIYIEAVFEVWFARSKKQWDMDLSFLDKCGIEYKKIDKKERAVYAQKKLDNS